MDDLDLNRRQLITGAAAMAGAAAFAAGAATDADAAAEAKNKKPAKQEPLPKPEDSGIEKIVVLMMENRSFDHFLGWLPGATRKQHLKFPDKKGKLHDTHHLKFFQSCGYYDPDHSYTGGRIEYAGGKLDGWLKTQEADLFPIGYYEQSDLSFYGHAAPYWTTCDHYFAPTLAPTYPNRFYMHSAQTDREDDSTTPFATMPAIWDLLADAHVSRGYYFSDIPFTALYGQRHLGISKPIATFMDAAKSGTLPSVSFVDPMFEDEGDGTSQDDHPLADIRAGQYFVSSVYEALVNGPDWDKTLLIVNYDEWGGFFDHVKPGKAPDLHPKFAQRGFRVPCMLMGPRVRRHHIATQTFDHASVLKLIEWRFGLPHLTPRDKAANNIAHVLDFKSKPNLEAPIWKVPKISPTKCGSSASPSIPTSHELEWAELKEHARKLGFDV